MTRALGACVLLSTLILISGCASSSPVDKGPDSESSFKAPRGLISRRYSTQDLIDAEPVRISAGIFDYLVDYSGDKDARAILVNCVAFVSRLRARYTRAICSLADEGHRDRFRRDVERRTETARLTPAIVAGEPHSTYFNFRVLLTRDDDRTSIEYFQNWGYDADKYGYAYQAPQRLYLPKQKHVASAHFGTPCVGSLVKSVISIDVDGNPHDDVEFQVAKGEPPAECFEYIQEQLVRSQYLPARVDNERVAARYIEVWPAAICKWSQC